MGAVTYLLGYAFTYGSMVSDGVDYSLDGVPFAKEVGWVFYSSQLVNIEVKGREEIETLQMFGENGLYQLTSSVPEIAYRAVPVLLLVVAGFLVCRRGKTGQTTTVSGAAIGASITVGYLVFVVLGQSFFKYAESGSEIVAQAPLVNSVVLIGLLYPVVFGGIGGMLASLNS